MDNTRQQQSLATDDILTPAETRIAIGYVAGLSGKEIADKNHIAYSTVVSHTQNIYEKAGIQRCTNALVAWFLRKNFDLDFAELKRRIGAFLLLCLVGLQMAFTDFDNSFVRARTTRTARTCRKAGKKGRRDDEPTIEEL